MENKKGAKTRGAGAKAISVLFTRKTIYRQSAFCPFLDPFFLAVDGKGGYEHFHTNLWRGAA